jgi:phosphatidylglycerophosphate synthase
VAGLICLAVGISVEGRLGLVMFAWTASVIAAYGAFSVCNLKLFRRPGGEPVRRMEAANALTALRIFLVPPIVILLFRGYILHGLILYIIAAVTDVADGFVARRFGQETSFGLMLDPVGDIVSTLAVFAWLWISGDVPTWLFVILALRYIQFFVGLAMLAHAGKLPRLHATWAGKIVGTIQGIGILILLIRKNYYTSEYGGVLEKTLYTVLGLAFFSVIVSQTVIGIRAVRGRGTV